MITQTQFDAATNKFTLRLERAASWKNSYFGAAYSTRIKQAIKEAREACTEMELVLIADMELTPPKE